ncbi:MAG: hypothetical protein HKN74_04750 [Acidimicrobiia bacterium]|nr:poly-gamma-glutamate hydrolase family protein [Acidimicrobiia bacterium]NNF09574.1 hypothetical protein [Acidimicrobiia bacterium]NNL68550.1 hypothetical protein [Acidimicrobiia bacterium]
MLHELLATPGVREEVRLAGPVGVMALHGGLEDGTAEAAAAVARATLASHYAIIQPDDLAWHIPSVEHDPRQSPKLRRFLEHVDLVVSFHGFGRKGLENVALVGGRNRRVAGVMAASLERRTGLRVISDPDRMPPGLAGMHPNNPVNLPASHGVQLELSPGARRSATLAAVRDAVAVVVAAEMASVCPDPQSAVASIGRRSAARDEK